MEPENISSSKGAHHWSVTTIQAATSKTLPSNFDVSLTVHLSITLANDQLDAQILNTFIMILYM
jgi:hypothetical protein